MTSRQRSARFEALKGKFVDGVVSGLTTAFSALEKEMYAQYDNEEQLSEKETNLDARQQHLNEKQESLQGRAEELQEWENLLHSKEQLLQEQEAKLQKVRSLFQEFETQLHHEVSQTPEVSDTVVVSDVLASLPVNTGESLSPRGRELLAFLQQHAEDEGSLSCALRNVEISQVTGMPQGTISCQLSRMRQDGTIDVYRKDSTRHIRLKRKLKNHEAYLLTS